MKFKIIYNKYIHKWCAGPWYAGYWVSGQHVKFDTWKEALDYVLYTLEIHERGLPI